MAPNPNGFATPSFASMLGISTANAATSPAAKAATPNAVTTPNKAPTVSFTAQEAAVLGRINDLSDQAGVAPSFTQNDDGQTTNVSFDDPSDDGSLNVTVSKFDVPNSLMDKLDQAKEVGSFSIQPNAKDVTAPAPAPSQAKTQADNKSTFGSTSAAAPTSTASAAARAASIAKSVDAAAVAQGGSGTGTAAKAASIATAALEASREPSVAATSLPGGTMTDAPSIADTVAQQDTTVSAPSEDMSGSWENRFGTGRSFYGSDSARAGADAIKGKATKDARATAMREARTQDPKAFVAATVLAELDPPQLKSLLSNADSQLEARKILDVIANRALLGGGYTRGNGPLGGVLGEPGMISAESLSDAAAAPSQFSPLNLTSDKATREANSRVMGFAAGQTNQAEMAFVLGLIDQMTQGGYTPATLDTHYFSKYMTKAPGWAKGMTRTKAGGHVFGSADAGTTDALIEAHAKTGTVGSGQPTGSEIADRIAKAMEMEGATRYDKEGNAYYKDDEGNLVDAQGNVVEESKTAKGTPETSSGDDGDLGQLHSKTDPNRVSAPDLDGLNENTKQAVVDLQKAWGKPLAIVSGFRGKGRNAKAGGAKKSQHMNGKAVDIDASDMTVAEKTQLISLASAMGFGGIGVYSGGSLHLDTRESAAMWGDDHTSKSVPKGFRGVKASHLAGKFKGRADEFARASETEFSQENANLPERNPFTAETARIAQGLKDAPDSSIAPANESAQGFANAIRDAIAKAKAKAEADPIGAALGGMTIGGTSTADAGIGPTGAVPAPERNMANTISAEMAAAADSSTGRQQVDAAARAKEASDAAVAAISQKVAEIRAEIEAGVTGMPATNFDTGRRQVSGMALGEAQAAAAEAAKTAELAPRDSIGAVQSGFAAGEAIAGAQATESRFSLADTLANNPSLLGFKDAPKSLDAEAAKSSYSVASVDTEQAAEDARGLIGQLAGPMSVTGKVSTVAKGTKAALAAAEANAKVAMAKAEKAIGQLGLPAAAIRSLKDVAKQAVARNLAEQKAQIAEADMNAKIERDAELAEKTDRRTAVAQAFSDSALSAPAALGGPTSTAPAAPTLSGLPDDAKVEPADTTTVDLGAKLKDLAKQIVDAPAKGLKVAKETVQKEVAKQVAKIETKLKESGVPQAIIGQAVAQARAQIAAQLSRGIDDEVIRQRRAEEKAKREAADKKAADKKTKKKQKPSTELEKLLAELSRAAA